MVAEDRIVSHRAEQEPRATRKPIPLKPHLVVASWCTLPYHDTGMLIPRDLLSEPEDAHHCPHLGFYHMVWTPFCTLVFLPQDRFN